MHHLSCVRNVASVDDEMMMCGILRTSQGPKNKREQFMFLDAREILADMIAKGVD